MLCPKCGVFLLNSATVCDRCGAIIDIPKPEVYMEQIRSGRRPGTGRIRRPDSMTMRRSFREIHRD